jgi:TATA-box binding protein (TBP) (component of TFIID and TFIIIB)
VIATVDLGCRLDLKTIALHARNAEYIPKLRSDSVHSESHAYGRDKIDVTGLTLKYAISADLLSTSS